MTDQQQAPQDPYSQGGAQNYQQPAYGQAPPAGGASGEMSPADQRMWAMLGHLGGILFGFLAPLIVWLVQKDRGAYVADQSKEALNFQLTLLIGWVVGVILSVIGIGLIIILGVWILTIVFGIIAGLAANKGETYRYPFNIRMVK